MMAVRSPVRDQAWMHNARPNLRRWKTNFDHTRSEIPKKELQQLPRSADSNFNSDMGQEESGSHYQPSSPLSESAAEQGRPVSTRSQPTGCAPSDSTSSPSSRQEARIDRSNQSQRHDAQYCTQRCLLGLKTGGTLDDDGPNVTLHRQDQDHPKHPINAEGLVLFLKIQLGKDLDRNCTPFGTCGSYGAPFKLTCTAYYYTVVGKGTTSRLWKEVSREAQVYQILRKTQGSAVPVFLGTIDLEVMHFHDAGDISHMLVMGWGGDSIANMELTSLLRREIKRSKKEIRELRVIHEELWRANIIWNPELHRALVIAFHRSRLNPRPISKRSGSMKRKLDRAELSDEKDGKQLRVL
ncbi:unnamed protein product [Penicillium nalgiovense]|nr:unnamed protein product [Penicillium nalgiovense]